MGGGEWEARAQGGGRARELIRRKVGYRNIFFEIGFRSEKVGALLYIEYTFAVKTVGRRRVFPWLLLCLKKETSLPSGE